MGCRAPRPRVEGVRAEVAQHRSSRSDALCGSLVILCRVGGIGLADHSDSLHNQQIVVNNSLGRPVIHSLDEAVGDACGGKAGTLGALRRAGFRVPDGFVVPFAAYRSVHRDDTEEADVGKPASGPALPAPLQESIARHLRGMDGRHVAVRSSASDEDRADTSAAGQYATVLVKSI